MPVTKLIVVIELEMERPVTDIGEQICQRITMHPHVQDANLLSIAESLEGTHAPKPVGVRSYIGAPKD